MKNNKDVAKVATTGVDQVKALKILVGGLLLNKGEALPNILVQLVSNLFDEDGATRVDIKYVLNQEISLSGNGAGFKKQDLNNLYSLYKSSKQEEEERGQRKHGKNGTGRTAAAYVSEELTYTSSHKDMCGANECFSFPLTKEILGNIISWGNTPEKASIDLWTNPKIEKKTSKIKDMLPGRGTCVSMNGIDWSFFKSPAQGKTLGVWLVKRFPESRLDKIFVNGSPLVPRTFEGEVHRMHETLPVLGQVEVTIGEGSGGIWIGGDSAILSVESFILNYIPEKYRGAVGSLASQGLTGIITIQWIDKFRTHESFGRLDPMISDEKEFSYLRNFLMNLSGKIHQMFFAQQEVFGVKDENIKKDILKELSQVYESGTSSPRSHGKREFTLEPANLILTSGEEAIVKIVGGNAETELLWDKKSQKEVAVSVEADSTSLFLKITPNKLGKYSIPVSNGLENIRLHLEVVAEKRVYLTPSMATVQPGHATRFTVKNLPENTKVDWKINGESSSVLMASVPEGDSCTFKVDPGTADNLFQITASIKGVELEGKLLVLKEGKDIQIVEIEDRLYSIGSMSLKGQDLVAQVDTAGKECRYKGKDRLRNEIKLNLNHPFFKDSGSKDAIYLGIFSSIVSYLVLKGEFVPADSLDALNKLNTMYNEFMIKYKK